MGKQEGYSVKAVANYFLSKHGSKAITPLKIQKLVYLSHGWHLAIYGMPLVNNEYPEAWRYGPVFPSLYHEFKGLGKMPIMHLATEGEMEQYGSIDPNKRTTPKIPKSDKRTAELLDGIWDFYGGKSATQLSNMTHRAGSPWHQAITKHKGKINAHISEDDIRNYYESKRKGSAKNGR